MGCSAFVASNATSINGEVHATSDGKAVSTACDLCMRASVNGNMPSRTSNSTPFYMEREDLWTPCELGKRASLHRNELVGTTFKSGCVTVGSISAFEGETIWKLKVAGTNSVRIGVIRSDADVSKTLRDGPGRWSMNLKYLDMRFEGDARSRTGGSFKVPCTVVVSLNCDNGTLAFSVTDSDGIVDLGVVTSSLPKDAQFKLAVETGSAGCEEKRLPTDQTAVTIVSTRQMPSSRSVCLAIDGVHVTILTVGGDNVYDEVVTPGIFLRDLCAFVAQRTDTPIGYVSLFSGGQVLDRNRKLSEYLGDAKISPVELTFIHRLTNDWWAPLVLGERATVNGQVLIGNTWGYRSVVAGSVLACTGVIEWKLKVEGTNSVRIGVIRSDADFSQTLRDGPGRWSMSLKFVDMRFEGELRRRKGGSIQVPCTVSMILDCENHTLAFSVEDPDGTKDLGVVTSSLPEDAQFKLAAETGSKGCEEKRLPIDRTTVTIASTRELTSV